MNRTAIDVLTNVLNALETIIRTDPHPRHVQLAKLAQRGFSNRFRHAHRTNLRRWSYWNTITTRAIRELRRRRSCSIV